MHKRVWLLGGCEGISPPPWENFEFRSSQIASDAIWDKLSKQHILATIITIHSISRVLGGKNSRALTPLYETLAVTSKTNEVHLVTFLEPDERRPLCMGGARTGVW